MKKILLCTAMISIMLFTSGCGRRTVTMPDEDTATERDFGNGEALKIQLGAEEKWEEELALNDIDLAAANIQAVVSVPDTDHMSVLTMKENPFTDEKRKAILEAVCDADSIYIVDEDIWPEWYTQKEINRVNDEITEMLQKKEKDPENFNEEALHRAEEELKIYEEMMERTQAQDKKAAGYYQTESYCGIRDGMNIRFDFREEWADWHVEEEPGSLTVKEGVSETANMDISYYEQKYLASENICVMPEEEAVQMAADCLEDIGYSGYGVYAVNSLFWKAYEHDRLADSWADGYKITFRRSVDGVLQEIGLGLPPVSMIYDAAKDSYESVCGLEEIVFFVNDKGILECRIDYPYLVEEVSAAAVPLLSYEQVQGVFRDILKNGERPNSYDMTEGQLNFNCMDLIYFCVADTEGDTYALLPAWVLADKEEDMYGDVRYENTMMINAIDGSLID